MLIRKHTLLAVALALVAFFASAKDMPVVDPGEIISKYGKPDRMESTEYDKPRPPFVTRMLDYNAYFSPSWTAFQAERGRDFSVIVDGISN